MIDNTEKTLIWSSFTKYEFEKKYWEINDNIDDYFQERYIVLINNDAYSYDFFEKIVLRNTKNIKINLG